MRSSQVPARHLLVEVAAAVTVCWLLACAGHGPAATPDGPALRMRAPLPEASFVAGESYYLQAVRPRGLAIDAITPSLLTPVADDRLAEGVPDTWVLFYGDGTYRSGVLPYVEALGEPRLGESEPAQRIASAWRTLRGKLDDPPGVPPVRVFVNHYPRPGLPGQCVTVQLIVYDVLDPFIAGERSRAFEAYAHLKRGESVPGRLLELRQVWQLEDAPRLVGALAEVTTECRFRTGHRRIDPRRFRDRRAAEILFDDVAGAHFPVYGGGDRHGLAWIDRSCGIGEPDPAQVSYLVPARPRLGQGAQAISVTPMEPEAAARLRAYVRRG